jgi:hypothetical protein
MAALGEQLE